MMPNSYIINSSRSELIDEEALNLMLKNNKIAGAGLDVFSRERGKNLELLNWNCCKDCDVGGMMQKWLTQQLENTHIPEMFQQQKQIY